jgi:acetyl-CoA carboxylase biotin carboxyl carrier protein
MSPAKQKATSSKQKARVAGKRTAASSKAKKAATRRKQKKPTAPKATTPARTPGKTTRRVAPSRVAGEINATIKMARDLAAIVERRSLSELIVETKDATFTLRRGDAAPPAPQTATLAAFPGINGPVAIDPGPPPPPEPVPSAQPSDDTAEGTNGEYHLVTSPFVGTFYRRPNPDSDNYVELGQRVEKGQVLCIIEAMKLMNEIEADLAGVIVAILVEDTDPVEYGQPLFKISPL